VIDILVPQLLDLIRTAQEAYHKLVIIAGSPNSGKTRLLNQVASQLDLPVMNLSLQLSRGLLNLTKRQRMLKAEEVARDAIDDQTRSACICLDNTELLFDSALNLNPLTFLKDVSRNRLIVASWNGVLADGQLRFGYSGHPDFFSEAVSGFPVVAVTEDSFRVYLTT